MQNTEHAYIQAGYKFERAQSPHAAQAAAAALRAMLEAEDIDDRAEARRLIEQGRNEARH